MLQSGHCSVDIPNSQLIKNLQLQLHPEGGYFRETARQDVQIPSPFANNEPRSLGTTIFYLLTYEEMAGKIHLNKSVTYHALHHGRAEYTLVTPGVHGAPPSVEKRVMGTNVEAGEQRLLVVGGGVWKMSKILDEDIQAAETAYQKERTGCLITEVVTPGFTWEDHKFLTEGELNQLFEHDPQREQRVEEFSAYLRA